MRVPFSIIVYSSIAGLSTILGVIMVRLKEPLILKYSHFINSFAAGLLLAISSFHIFPESLELSHNALFFIFLGFLVFYLFVGLFFHSLIDGLIIGVGFEIDPKLGILASLRVISHELPEGVTTFSLLIQAVKRKAALKLSIAVALATPIGA
jgi:zinc transporter ZupT